MEGLPSLWAGGLVTAGRSSGLLNLVTIIYNNEITKRKEISEPLFVCMWM